MFRKVFAVRTGAPTAIASIVDHKRRSAPVATHTRIGWSGGESHIVIAPTRAIYYHIVAQAQIRLESMGQMDEIVRGVRAPSR